MRWGRASSASFGSYSLRVWCWGPAAGALGLALATWDLRFTKTTIPVMAYRFVPGLRDMKINGDTIVLGIVLAIVVSVLCCVPAAMQVFGSRLRPTPTKSSRKAAAVERRASRSRIRSILVIAEVALAFVLLVGAGLMVGTFRQMLNVNLGYDPNNVLMGEIVALRQRIRKARTHRRFLSGRYSGTLSRLPDVQAAAASGTAGPPALLYIEGRPQPRPGEPEPEIRASTPQYLQAMRIPLRQGRWISEQDGPNAPRVVVVSEFVARHYWPGSSPIGQRIRFGKSGSPWLTVVGVAGDRNDWFLGNPMPAAYVSYQQFPRAAMQVFIRTLHDPLQIAGGLRRAADRGGSRATRIQRSHAAAADA